VRLGLISATVSIVANLILVPRLGAVGSALANTLSQLTTATMLMVCAHVFYRLDLPWKRVGIILLVGITSTYLVPTAIHELMPDTVGLLLAILAAGLCYAGLLWRLGYHKHLLSLRDGRP
jgi:O-antigen/teichoic acid export membrane protein